MPTGERSRNRRGEGARLREEIVSAAAELLDDGGTEKDVTLRAVARRVGISAPSIYQHFPDTASILLAVTQAAFAELHRELDAVPPGTDPVGHLRAVCAAYLDFASRRPHRYRVMFGGVWNARDAATLRPELAPAAAVLGAAAFDVLGAALGACAAQGSSASVDPVADATSLWVGLHGLAGLRAVAPLFPWPPRVEHDLVDRLALLTATPT